MPARPASTPSGPERTQDLLRQALRVSAPAEPATPAVPGPRAALDGTAATRRQRRGHRDETRFGGRAAAGRGHAQAVNPRHLAYRRQG